MAIKPRYADHSEITKLSSGPTTGIIYTRVEEIRDDAGVKEKAAKGDLVTIPLTEKVRSSDRVYIITER